MRAAYIYYRIDPVRAIETASCIDALLSAMAPHCLQPPRRLRRCDDAGTWMEIYEGIEDWPAFVRALELEAKRCDADRHATDGRHIECFSTFENQT